VDAFDNDHLPDLKILPSPAVQFETLKYLVPQTREIEVKNVGKVRVLRWAWVRVEGD
jgi:hypothetical protein